MARRRPERIGNHQEEHACCPSPYHAQLEIQNGSFQARFKRADYAPVGPDRMASLHLGYAFGYGRSSMSISMPSRYVMPSGSSPA